jgi:CPA2 family monovalent cation:H+ antiporter-2
MHSIPILDELLIVAGVGVVAAVALARLRLPTVTGLLIAGAIVGPHGLRFVQRPDAIQQLAEIGVVFLLFTIGLEFSLSRLARIWRHVAIGGSLQVGLTVVVTMLAAMAIGFSMREGLFFGFIVSLSSTAIVLRTLSERRELDAPHGRFIVGVLLFQDLCVVPMALVVPLLASGGAGIGLLQDVGLALGKAALVVGVVMTASRLLLPHVFAWVDATRSREVFLLAVLSVCIGTAWLSALAGLSLALGAFLAGIVLAGTDYGTRAIGDVLPLRSLLASIFFVSLGMLFDVRVVLERPVAVSLLLAGFLFGKGIFATLAALVMRFPAKVAWQAGVGLAQFGEFGFVLASLGEQAGLVDRETGAPLLAAGVLSMLLTPIVLRVAPQFAAGERILRPLARLLGARGTDELEAAERGLRDHVVVVGFGVGGRLVAKALAESRIPYVVLEMNAETVRRSRLMGEPIYYGDITSSETMQHAGLDQARALVLMISDPDATMRAVAAAHMHSPRVPILVRVRYLSETDALRRLGAGDVAVEEVEASAEMIARLLRRVGLPGNVIANRVRTARGGIDDATRDMTIPPRRLGEMSDIQDLKVESFLLSEDAYAAGRTLAGLRLRTLAGALAVARRHDGRMEENPDPAAALAPGDTLFLVGTAEQLRRATELLETGAGADAHEPA